jgi:S1-C subfamily serine protease
VLKIDEPAVDLPVIPYVDFEQKVSVGSLVLAIGNSLHALQNSVTFGIVSATNRNLITTDSDTLYA